jgi:hypothetical protein
VHRRTPIEASVDCVVAHIRLGNPADHVEMNWVLSHKESLSNIVQLQVFDSSHNTFITWSVEHDLSTKLGLDGCWITAEDNIARHEANFSSHS